MTEPYISEEELNKNAENNIILVKIINSNTDAIIKIVSVLQEYKNKNTKLEQEVKTIKKILVMILIILFIKLYY
jgi:hypothetical protein